MVKASIGSATSSTKNATLGAEGSPAKQLLDDWIQKLHHRSYVSGLSSFALSSGTTLHLKNQIKSDSTRSHFPVAFHPPLPAVASKQKAVSELVVRAVRVEPGAAAPPVGAASGRAAKKASAVA